MKNRIFLKALCFMLALLTFSIIPLYASAASLCTPTSFEPIYYPETDTISYKGTYSGIIQPTRVYKITLVDANGRMISTKNPTGSELDKGNGVFEVSYSLSADSLTSYTMPMKATLSCTTANVMDSITATVTEYTVPETVTISFVVGEGGTLSGNTAATIPYNTSIDDLDPAVFPTPVPDMGYRFDSWLYTVDGTSFVQDTVFTAVFKCTLGDVNCDGGVDNLDASLLLQYDAGLISETISTAVGDTDFDGIVDNSDAATVLKYDAGLINGFER